MVGMGCRVLLWPANLFRSPMAMKYLPVTRCFGKSQPYAAVDLEHFGEARRCKAEGLEASRIAALLDSMGYPKSVVQK